MITKMIKSKFKTSSKQVAVGGDSIQSKIIITKLTKTFGKKIILNELDLEVKKNESLVILGGSGSGKSVLIKAIVGLLQIDSGSVKFDGNEISNLSRSEKSHLMSRFGFLFQGGALFDSLRVWENVSFSLIHNKSISVAEAKDIALAKLHSVGMNEDIMYLFPSELSGGMQKRVALARAIATNPEVVFFDEPTTGLDPIMANVINDLIIGVRNNIGATTVTITHDINSARRIATRVAMLFQGKITWIGDVHDIDKSGNSVFEQFINGKSTGPIKVDVS